MDFLNAKFINLFDITKLREKFFIKKTKNHSTEKFTCKA